MRTHMRMHKDTFVYIWGHMIKIREDTLTFAWGNSIEIREDALTFTWGHRMEIREGTHTYSWGHIRLFYPCDRGWRRQKHIQKDSSTEDTSEEVKTGGLGKYSHGSICLVHQHWVEQVISAGSFGVHCTEAAEAHHKTSMRLSSNRVRHSRPNRTQHAMLKYLLRHFLFESLRFEQPVPPTRQRQTRTTHLVQVPLPPVTTQQGERVVRMGRDLHETRNQMRFIHPEVRLARVELMDLFCGKLGLTKTRQSYRLLNRLKWTFAQKLVMPNATFWATDSQYSCATSEHASQRRDKFLLRGTEPCTVVLPNGETVVKSTALCCEAVCFLRIDDLQWLRSVLPAIPGR